MNTGNILARRGEGHQGSRSKSPRIHPAATFIGMRAALTAMQPFEFAGYMAILLSADGRTGKTPRISYLELAATAHMSERQMIKVVKKLRAAGWIDATAAPKTNIPNAYALKWDNADSKLNEASPSSVQQNHTNSQGVHLMHSTSVQGEQGSSSLCITFTPDMHHVHKGGECGAALLLYQDKDKDKCKDSNQDDYTTADADETPVVVVVDDPDPTPPEEFSETETATGSPDEQTEPPAPASIAPTVYSLYADNFGQLTAIIGERLDEMVTTYGDAEVREALTIAVLAEKRSLKYVEGVLRNRSQKATPRTRTGLDLRPDTGPLPQMPEAPALPWLADGQRDEPPAIMAGQRLWREAAEIARIGRMADWCRVSGWDGQTLRLQTHVERSLSLNTTLSQVALSALAQVYGQPVGLVVELVEAEAVQS